MISAGPVWSGSLIEGHDFHPIRSLARRILADELQPARAVDGIRRDGGGLLAGHDHVPAGGIDAETARLLLRRRRADIGELAGGAVDAQRVDGARRALGGEEEAAVRCEVHVGSPDIVRDVASRRGPWRAWLQL